MSEQLTNIVGLVKNLASQVGASGGICMFADIPNGPPTGKFWRVLFASITIIDTGGTSDFSGPPTSGIGIISSNQPGIVDGAAPNPTLDQTNRGNPLPVNFIPGIDAVSGIGFYLLSTSNGKGIVANGQTIRGFATMGTGAAGFTPWNNGSTLTLNVQVQELPLDPCADA